ncbi:MAG: hypothetical protein AABX70_06340 [Nanoarchaeota archaeon]
MRTLRKKGDLSLSVNAIVVLILAIVLLAFGLSFITKLLSKGESSLEGLFPSPQVQPTSTKPIAIPDSLLIKSGDQVRFSIPILNTVSAPLSGGLVLSGAGCPNTADVVSESFSTPLQSGQVGTLKLLIKGSPSFVDNSICAINIGGPAGLTQSFFLTTKGSI